MGIGSMGLASRLWLLWKVLGIAQKELELPKAICNNVSIIKIVNGAIHNPLSEFNLSYHLELI